MTADAPESGAPESGAPRPAGFAIGSRNFMIAVYAAQFFFGGWFVAHGLNQWLEFFPRPKGSSPVARELIMALNHSGLFDIIKGMEVVTGALLLANRFVPLAIVCAFPIALSIAHLNLLVNPDLPSKIIGVVVVAILGLVALGRLDRFLPMLAFNAGDPSDRGLRQMLGGDREERAAIRPWIQALAVIAGIAAAVGLTFWSTSAAGPRSAANAERVSQEMLAPR